MVRLLCSLRQDSDQRWLVVGVKPGTDYLFESYRSWEHRSEAQEALTAYLNSEKMLSLDMA